MVDQIPKLAVKCLMTGHLPSNFLESPFLSCDNAALEKSQVLPAMMNDCDDDDNYADEDLELSQNITKVTELPAKVTTYCKWV